MPARAAGEFSTWKAEGKSPAIQYSLEVMEEIRAAAVEGYRSLPRTGMEIGGVLFGYREGGVTTIMAQRPLECEHAMGPAFLLSKRDEAALNTLVIEARHDPGLANARPVGWYHSHTRSEIMLSDEDLELFERHFPERWQVALVLRPQKFGPCQAGFFIREEDGSVRAEASYREFTLEAPEPAARKKPVRRREAEEPTPEPEPEAPARTRAPGGGAWKSAFFAALVALAIVGALLVAVAAFEGRSYFHLGPAPAPAMSLRVLDINGELVIAWDRLSEAVRGAESGALEISDGGEMLSVPLDRDHLAAAGMTYARRSGTVEVRMATYAGGRTLAREAVSFAGPVHASSDASKLAELVRQRDDAVRERDQALRQVNGLREEMRAEAQKKTELESAVRALRQRLAVETSLRRK